MQILFIGPTRIGDAVLSSGVLAWMLARWPHARLTVAAGPAAAPFYAEAPRLEEIIVLEKQPAGGHWRRLWWRTVGRYWRAIADTRRSAVTWLVPAGRRFVMGNQRAGQHKVVQASAMTDISAWRRPDMVRSDAGGKPLAGGRDALGAIGRASPESV